MGRRSIRLRDYDYRQNGAYFVTICTHQGACLFDYIADGKMVLNELGMIVKDEWQQTEAVRSSVQLDAFVVMPNHVHGIILIFDNDDERLASGTGSDPTIHATDASRTLQSDSLGAIVGQFKSAVTRKSMRLARPPNTPIWQRNYYEHIIRSEESLDYIRKYIVENPARWSDDRMYVE